MKRSVAMAALLTLFTVTGCTSTTEVGMPIYQSSIDTIEKGVTGENELRVMFGQPYSVTKDQSGNTTLTYVYGRSSMKMFTGQIESSGKTLVVTLDSNGKVASFVHSEVGNPFMNLKTTIQ